MEAITKEKLAKAKEEALIFFKKNKAISSPCFWWIKIKVTPNGFNHLEWQRENHRRSANESFMRYVCFKHIKYILNNLELYQEYKEEMREFFIKKKGKKVKQKRIVEYFWFVAIVNNNKNRIKVVISKIDWWDNFEFVSVVPYWKMEWYSKLFFEEKA